MVELHGFGEQLALGTWMTVRLACAAVAIGLLLGLAGAGAKLSSSRALRSIGSGYTTLVRGIPELLVVLMVYFGSSTVLMSIASLFGYDEYIEISPFVAGTAALGFTFGAYASEVFRGAFMAIPSGQKEAAQALGMSRAKTFRRILLPQVWRVALPGLGNLFMVLLKDTALVSVIGLEELMRKTTFAVGHTKEPFTFYLAAAFIYLGLTVLTMAATHFLERRANRGLRGART